MFIVNHAFTLNRESQKHENWKTAWELLTDIWERMKGNSIKPNMWKISEMLLEFYWALLPRPSLLIRARIWSQEISMSHVFWDSLYIIICTPKYKDYKSKKKLVNLWQNDLSWVRIKCRSTIGLTRTSNPKFWQGIPTKFLTRTSNPKFWQELPTKFLTRTSNQNRNKTQSRENFRKKVKNFIYSLKAQHRNLFILKGTVVEWIATPPFPRPTRLCLHIPS